jgi:hypothetical protein
MEAYENPRTVGVSRTGKQHPPWIDHIIGTDGSITKANDNRAAYI